MSKKPQLKDFTGNRKEKSRKYNIALKKWRESQKDSSGKRTSYVDILGFKWKKEGDKYVQYRGDGSKTGKTRPYDRNANKKQTSRGSRPDNTKKTSNDLKVKKESYAKDRVGKVDLNSQEYKEAKAANEREVKYQTKKTSGVGPVKDGDSYAKNLKKTTQGAGPVKDGKTYAKNATKYKQVTQEELDKKIAEGKKNEKLKVKPKKMHAIEKRNRERFGDAHVDKLKAQYKAFKEKRKKKKNK